MKQLSEKQVTKKFGDKAWVLPRRGAPKSNLNYEALEMPVGGYLFISRKEWAEYGYAKSSSPANLLISATSQPKSPLHGRKFSYRSVGKDKRGSSDSGWLIKRIK